MKIFFATTFILVCSFAKSQEFWLHPSKFKYNVGEELKVLLLKGDNFVGEPLTNKNLFEKIELLQLTKQTDLTNQVNQSDKSIFKVKLEEEGTYQIAAVSKEIIIDKSAQEFNDDLKKLDLDEVMNIRTKSNSLNKPVRENSFTFSKLIVQSGNKTNDTFKKKNGAKLEIIPLQNPTTLKTGDYIQCLILFDGKPLQHQLVKVWNKIGNASILQNTYTENDGRTKFPISSRGQWMVSTIKMIASEKAGADWQSFKGSLMFGIE